MSREGGRVRRGGSGGSAVRARREGKTYERLIETVTLTTTTRRRMRVCDN